jgi:hypothetical protein
MYASLRKENRKAGSMNDTKGNAAVMPRQKKDSQRIRRRRASTGGKFGGIQSQTPSSPSASASSSQWTSPRGSPLSVRDTYRSSSFDEAFKNGTVLPYVLDSAFRSLDFADIYLCSSFQGGCEILGVNDGGMVCQQHRLSDPSTLRVRVNDGGNCNPKGNAGLVVHGIDSDSIKDVRGLPIILPHDGNYREGFSLIPNPLENERDHDAEKNCSETPQRHDGSLLSPRRDSPENTTEQDNQSDNQSDNNINCRLDGIFAEQGHCLFSPGVMLVRKNNENKFVFSYHIILCCIVSYRIVPYWNWSNGTTVSPVVPTITAPFFFSNP